MIVLLLLMVVGCSHVLPQHLSECHALTVNEFVERVNSKEENGAVEKNWLVWCGEGRYVVFRSSVAVGDFVPFKEYQEDDETQVRGYIERRK